ncbi:MAG TPA: GLPGLI family protein [Niastella sp.]
MKKIYLFLAFVITGCHLRAQQSRFLSNGRIEFEKSVNTYALIREGQLLGKNIIGNERQLLEEYQAKQPQFKVLKSTLYFRDNKTLFVPASQMPAGGTAPLNIPMVYQNNTVYVDWPARHMVNQKSIFGENFLLNDSIRNISWKITSEMREVAGFTCRRANALIMDSIYVVAFYTEDIHVSGGPETFCGLPGMILQLALPHEHVIWRATNVIVDGPTERPLTPPQKGKPIDYRQLGNMLAEIGKNYRNPYAARLIMKTLSL